MYLVVVLCMLPHLIHTTHSSSSKCKLYLTLLSDQLRICFPSRRQLHRPPHPRPPFLSIRDSRYSTHLADTWKHGFRLLCSNLELSRRLRIQLYLSWHIISKRSKINRQRRQRRNIDSSNNSSSNSMLTMWLCQHTICQIRSRRTTCPPARLVRLLTCSSDSIAV